MPKTPSEVLRVTIQKQGLTAYAVAKAAGLSRPDSVQRFINGDRGLNLDTFDAICTALGLELVPTSKTTRSKPTP